MPNLRRVFQEKLEQKQNVSYIITGLLGSDTGIVKVPNRTNYVYVRIAGSGIAEIFNSRVQAIYDLPVICGYDPLDPNKFQVLSIDGKTLDTIESSVSIGAGYAPASRYRWLYPGGGQDPLFVEGRQFMPLRLTPTNALNIIIDKQVGWSGTNWQITGGFTEIDLTSYVPTTEGKCCMVLISLDQDGSPVVTKGDEVDIADLVITDIPIPPAGTRYAVGAVRLYYGQTLIQEARTNTDIVDLRFSNWNAGSSGSSGSTISTIPIYCISDQVSWNSETLYSLSFIEPQSSSYTALNTTIDAGNDFTIAEFISDPLNVTQIPAGDFEFKLTWQCSEAISGQIATFSVYIAHDDFSEDLLISSVFPLIWASTSEVSSLSVVRTRVETLAEAVTTLATDRLKIEIIFHNGTTYNNTNFYLFFGGLYQETSLKIPFIGIDVDLSDYMSKAVYDSNGDGVVDEIPDHTHTESEITDLDHDAVKLQGRNLANTVPSDAQVISWDNAGSTWKPAFVDWDNVVNKPPLGIGTLYLHNDISGIGTYESLLESPSGGTEDTDSQAVVVGDGEVLIDGYISDELGTTIIPGGDWLFQTFTKVSSVAGISEIVIRVYKRSALGVETELFNTTTGEINDTDVAEYLTETVQSDFAVATDDRLLIKYFAKTNSAASITIYLYYEGTTHYSKISTPFSLSTISEQNDNISYSENDISNPPTEENIVAAFGGAEEGKLGLLNDGGLGLSEYLCIGDGDNWNFLPIVKAKSSLASSSLVRQGVVLEDEESGETTALEPSVIYENGVWKMWYTYGWNTNYIGYATSSDGFVWKKYPSNPVLSGYYRNSVFKDGNTYHMYAAPTGDVSVDHFTSTDGINWTLAQADVITIGGASDWDGSHVHNTFVWKEGTNDWRMLYAGNLTGSGYGARIGYATSSDGNTWTKHASNPVVQEYHGTVGGPFVYKSGSTYYLWANYTPENLTMYTLPTDLALYHSTDLISWTFDGIQLTRATADEGVGSGVGQIADPFIVVKNGVMYLFHAASADGTQYSGEQKIKLVTGKAELIYGS